MKKYKVSKTKDRKKAEKLYEDGESIFAISRSTGFSWSCINNWRKTFSWLPQEKKRKQKEEARLLKEKGQPTKEIQNTLNVSRGTLRNWGIL